MAFLPLDQELTDAYLSRIGAKRPERPDAEALRYLHERHVMTVPFENLCYHAGQPVPLDRTIVDKVVHERRGGGCYEVNPALGYLLTTLGYSVELLPARVWIDDRLGVPLGHVVLRVRLADGSAYLADVGLGRNSRWPLSLDTTEVQEDPHGRFRVAALPQGGYEVWMNDVAQYQADDRPLAEVADLGATLWWYRTNEASPFLQQPVCSLPTETGRITLRGRQLTRKEDGHRSTEEITDDDRLIEVCRELFGITLAPQDVPRPLEIDPDSRAVRVREP